MREEEGEVVPVAFGEVKLDGLEIGLRVCRRDSNNSG